MSKVAIVTIFSTKMLAFGGNFTWIRGKCTISYKPLINPQSWANEPARIVYKMAVVAKAAVLTVCTVSAIY